MLHYCKTLQKRGYRLWNAHRFHSRKAPAVPQECFSNTRKAVLLQCTRCQCWASDAQLSPTFLKRWPASPELWWEWWWTSWTLLGWKFVHGATLPVFFCSSNRSERWWGPSRNMCGARESIRGCFNMLNERQLCLNGGGWYAAVKNIFQRSPCHSSNAPLVWPWWLGLKTFS